MSRRLSTVGLLALILCFTVAGRTAFAGVIDNVLLQWRAQADKCEDPGRLDDMTMLHVAMFEAVNSIAGKYTPYKAMILAPPGSSQEAAAAAAAHGILVSICPDMKSAYDGALKKSLAKITDSVARENGAAVGRKAAEVILASRANAHSTGRDAYFTASKAGVYVPTLREVGRIQSTETPWVMTKSDELRPPVPPALGSALWQRDYNEIKRYGAKKSKDRTDEQTNTAKFWAVRDVRIVLPQLVGLPGRSLVDDARFLALAEMAWEDSYISMMDGKYAYNFWRPVTAVRGGAMDLSDSTVADSDWEPLVNTPPHPEYPCGHCLSAGAVGTVIAKEFGKDMPPIVLQGDSVMPRRFITAQEYIDEVGEARMLAGVHYRNSVNVGKAMGVSIGNLAVERYFKPARSGPSKAKK